jgi:hypothetical protein
MKRPVHQQLLVMVSFLLAGIIGFGAVLSAVSSSLSIVTPTATYLGTLTAFVFWFLADAVLNFRPLRWVVQGGKEIRLRRLGWIPKISLLAVVLLLWAPRVSDYVRARKEGEFAIPELAVKLVNKTDNDVQVQDRGEFVLSLPTGYGWGAPTYSGRTEVRTSDRDTAKGNSILIPARQEKMVSVKFLNAAAYRQLYEGESSDVELVFTRIGGVPISMRGTIPFSKKGLEDGYILIAIEN